MAEEEKKEMIEIHNMARDDVNVSPLKWSEKLQRDAQSYAEKLAEKKQMEHDQSCEDGENLANGSGGSPDGAMTQAANMWLGEKDDYEEGRYDHYTQMVWKDTKKVGCAKAVNGDYWIVVCRYTPKGNMKGEKAF